MKAVLRTCVVVFAASALLAVGCGSSDDSGSGPSTSAAAGSFSEPLRIIGMWEVEGESTVAKSILQNGAELAIEEINAAGGVGGRPIEYERVATPLAPPEEVAAAVRLALESNPSALIGVASGSAAVVASPLVDAGEVPLLTIGQSDQVLLTGSAGSEWVFSMRPTEVSAQETAARFAVEGLGKKKVGLLHVSTEYGARAVPVQRATVEELGGQVVADREYAVDANDLTEQVLAMKDAEVVVNWAFPNPLGVQLNQFVQNDIRIPTVDAAAAGIVVGSNLASGQAIEDLYGVTDCNPADDPRAEVRAWSAAYKERFGYDPDFSAAGAYDAVHLIAEAARIAGSPDPADVQRALKGEVRSTELMCSMDYYADAANTLNHQQTIIAYAGGVPKTREIFEIDPAR
jgi:branched-chain amino acid transport system substrate-binding protein